MEDIPKLEDYDISPKTGFVPLELPAKTLNDVYYKPWERLAKDIPSLIMCGRLIDEVNNLPLLKCDKLFDIKNEIEKLKQIRRAYCILTFLTHAYIWTKNPPSDTLPQNLTKPLLLISDFLHMPPTVTYAAVCLWNHRIICDDFNDTDDNTIIDNHSSSILDLSNTTAILTFTGSIDESWFYIISTVLEIKGACCINYGIEVLKEIKNNNTEKVMENLQKLAESINMLIPILSRMYEQCDPHVFYYRIRPFLAGSKNMSTAGLPNGVKYGDEKDYRQYSGGSNAQSSLIQTLDILLGVQHRITGKKSTDKSDTNDDSDKKQDKNNFIHEMRSYMPLKHREFLQHLEKVSNIKQYVQDNNDSFPGLTLSYDACLAVLKAFRDKHIQIVSRYIVLQKSASEKGNSSTIRAGLANSADKANSPFRGTGGTALMAFLKQARDETAEAAAGSWGRRLLRDSSSTPFAQSNFNLTMPSNLTEREEYKPVVMGSTWSIKDKDAKTDIL